MTDQSKDVEATEQEDDPAPELKIVPIEDLDKIEKLLDVAISCVQTPNLPYIKAACMQELKEIDNALGVQIEAAQEEYRVALAEWDNKRIAKAAEARKKVDEENKQREKEAQERGVPDSVAGSPRDTLAYPTRPATNGIERRI